MHDWLLNNLYKVSSALKSLCIMLGPVTHMPSCLFRTKYLNTSLLDWQDSHTFSLSQAMPNWRVLMVLACSALSTHYSEKWVMDRNNFLPTAAQHVGVGIACLAVLVTTVYKCERPFLQELANFRGSHSKSE